jgi:hypothetical protein
VGASLIRILSDINMPGMTGLELLPKGKAARPDVPVIMITVQAASLRSAGIRNPQQCRTKIRVDPQKVLWFSYTPVRWSSAEPVIGPHSRDPLSCNDGICAFRTYL